MRRPLLSIKNQIAEGKPGEPRHLLFQLEIRRVVSDKNSWELPALDEYTMFLEAERGRKLFVLPLLLPLLSLFWKLSYITD